MFPAPIERASAPAQLAYRIAVPLALLVWLLPLFAVALTSVRSIEDLNEGNFWGWPKDFAFWDNYTGVFLQSNMGRFILNSVMITLPAVAGAVALSMHGWLRAG